MDINIVCINCKHLFEDNTKLQCKAFPKGIAKSILVGTNDHSKPISNQKNDIVFEKIED